MERGKEKYVGKPLQHLEFVTLNVEFDHRWRGHKSLGDEIVSARGGHEAGA
jgi:hypothetical protein